ncbi:restriction endonuclease subunit S [Empedobacter sp. GD03797]|uniref:restriction endonuclease subunit S n=1 Tax=Empedobacter sp. GD03797 TaxID=2975382 RepID=UPI00244B85D0|nr:restriction endonuclease subunit S [Empedobacter sp. GD03797]MDH1882553.1 restriction endonuclease subunit S [Empedobacter sp. GD03797]
MINKKLKVGNVPNLRFPEFTEEWETKKLGEISSVSSGGTPSRANPLYWDGDIPWISTTLIDFNLIEKSEEYITQEGLENSSAKLFPIGTLLMAMYGQGKTRGKVAILNIEATTNQACGAIITNEEVLNSFFAFQNLVKRYDEIRDLSNQGSQENLSGGIIKGIKITFPKLSEQIKITSFLSLIDERIQTQNKIIEELKLLKNTIRYQLYEQILNQENEYIQIKDTLNYEQPTKYLVTNTDYSPDSSLNPVLTANKAFILGYTDELFGVYNKGNCIIFDDFTMDMKFVDFPFKVKSSAIKILTAKPNVNLKFIFEYLSFLNLSSNEHKRHYISEIEPMKIQLPNYIQQKHVADFLSSIDDKVKTEFEIHMLLIKQKQYLLANLFI